MFTSTGRAPRLIPGTAPRRIAAILAAVAGGVAAWAAVIPAATAAIIPVPAEDGGYGPGGGTPAAIPVRAIVTGGMPGWQITLIAVSAAVITAAAAVCLDRALTARRAGLMIAARRPPRAAHRHAARHTWHPGTDRAVPAASTPDTAPLPGASASSTPDVVEFGRNLAR